MTGAQAICPECGLPVGPIHPGARVYHWMCLEVGMKLNRREWDKETNKMVLERMFGNAFDIKGCQTGRTYQIKMTCPKCKRLVNELDETYLCSWCASLEEEC